MRLPSPLLTPLLLLQACIPLTTPGATGNNIVVDNYFFTPVFDTATAQRNDSVTVTFRWADSSVGHSVVWDSGPSALPPDKGLTFTGTYAVNLVAGTYTYHCGVHRDAWGMMGQIVIIPFGVPTASKARQPDASLSAATDPVRVTRPRRGSAPGSPKREARRSRPATT